MAITIAVANQKGGVGKTTTCVNLVASLAARQQQVLLIDLDPQGNATVGSGVDKDDITVSVNELLMAQAEIAQAIMTLPVGYDLIAANADLTIAEVSLLQFEQREQRLARAIETIKTHYDYIFIDCPPTLNMLTVNALVAADSVLIPMQCEYYALEGLTGLLGTIEKIRQSANPSLEIAGLVRTLYDGRNSLTQQVSAQLQKHFGDKVFQTVIPRNVRLAEAPSYGLPAILYDKTSSGALAYLALADELLAQKVQHIPVSSGLLKRHNEVESHG